MIPEYFYLVVALAGFAYIGRSVTETYLMIRDYRDSKNPDLKNEGLQALLR
jgi:hypothetical protein